MFTIAVIEIRNYCEHSQYSEHVFERNLSYGIASTIRVWPLPFIVA